MIAFVFGPVYHAATLVASGGDLRNIEAITTSFIGKDCHP